MEIDMDGTRPKWRGWGLPRPRGPYPRLPGRELWGNVQVSMPFEPMRQRRTQEQMETLRGAIYAVAEADRPVSIRHIFYRMVTQNLVDKSARGYQQLQKATVDMRDTKALPYAWIEDSSRHAYWNTGYAGLGNFAEAAALLYRRDYWGSTGTIVEVWCESRSLAGVLGGVCREYVVPLFPSSGFSSLSFLYQASTLIQESERE